MSSFKRATLCMFVWLATAGAATAQTVSMPLVVDADAGSSDNFATLGTPQLTPVFLDVNLFATNEIRAALEFDISTLPVPGDIVSASLVLYLEESNALIGVHAATGDGAITDSDFLFANQITTFDPSSGSPAVENVVDVTAYVQSVAGVDPGVVFQLRELFDNEANAIFGSGNGSSNFHPRLDVTLVPEPVSAALVGMGGALLGGRRRRGFVGSSESKPLNPSIHRILTREER